MQTVVWKARVLRLHAALGWPGTAACGTELWPMALAHAACWYIITPKMESGLSPIEIFSGCKSNPAKFHALGRQRTWGCPAYVLHPVLGDGKKLPKWQPRSRRGMFVGHLARHGGSVGNILNLKTGSISPQFHVVYDNFFETVYAAHDKVPAV